MSANTSTGQKISFNSFNIIFPTIQLANKEPIQHCGIFLTENHGKRMQLFETSTESFIVKIWVETEEHTETWRGQIVHVLSGEQQDFYSLDEIHRFMIPYLQDIGLEVGSNWSK